MVDDSFGTDFYMCSSKFGCHLHEHTTEPKSREPSAIMCIIHLERVSQMLLKLPFETFLHWRNISTGAIVPENYFRKLNRTSVDAIGISEPHISGPLCDIVHEVRRWRLTWCFLLSEICFRDRCTYMLLVFDTCFGFDSRNHNGYVCMYVWMFTTVDVYK